MTSPRVPGIGLDALLGQAREPAFLLGPDRRFIGVNQAFEELVGHSSEQVLGLLCNSHGPTRPGDLAGLGGSFAPPPEALAGTACSSSTLIFHSSGERLLRRLQFWPFQNKHGDLVGLLGLIRAISEPSPTLESLAQRLRIDLLGARWSLQERHGFDTLVGHGVPHGRLMEQVGAAAASQVNVLIVGEPGTGKRTVARAIHARSINRECALYLFDPAALPAEVLITELFGRRDDNDFGLQDRSDPRSALVQPAGSTILLHDVLELTRDLQARLAEALDGRVRLLATSDVDPEISRKTERLNPDLYYAITSLVIRLRPLRERIDELPVLAQAQLERANQRGGRQREGFTVEALQAMLTYDWPGNLRELSRVIDAAHEVGTNDLIEVSDLPPGISGHMGGAYLPPPPPDPTPLDDLLNRVERKLIEQALVRARQNKSRAADLLGISRPRLYRRIKELVIADEPEPLEEIHGKS